MDVDITTPIGTIDAAACRHAYQAQLIKQVEKGTLKANGRVQRAWDKDTWPRSAFWVRGVGAFATPDVSDAPVLAPFQPLGEFLGELGREPTDEEVTSYMNRLRERGWQLSPTLEHRLKGGAGQNVNAIRQGHLHDSYARENSGITRIDELFSDADMIGDVVWAFDRCTGIWWPAEVLDPLALPAGSQIPQGATDLLSSASKRASLPSQDGSWDPAVESGHDRRVLVVYLPSEGATWEVSSLAPKQHAPILKKLFCERSGIILPIWSLGRKREKEGRRKRLQLSKIQNLALKIDSD